MKQALSGEPVLAMYNPEAHTKVHTEFSSKGVAATLAQMQDDGKIHPISRYSHKTSNDEEKYHSYELEALAIVCALERFRVYLNRIE